MGARKRILAAILGGISLFCLASCYDLGDFADLDDYYDSFSSATFYDKSFSSTSYSIKDYLYNEDTQNNFNHSDSGITFIDEEYYSYMKLELEKDITINSMAFFVYASTSDTFEVELYHTTSFDTGSFSSYDATEKESTDLKNPVKSDTYYSIANDWAYVEMGVTETFNDGDYLIVKFVNNTYDGKKEGLGLVSFKLVNLLFNADF